MKDFLFVQLDYVEQVLDIVDYFVCFIGVDVIVVDSVMYKFFNFFFFLIILYVMFILIYILVLCGVFVLGGRNVQNNMVILIFEIGGLWQVVVFVLKVEFEGDMGDFQMVLQVCLMSKVFCRFIYFFNFFNCLFIFINQVLI